MGWVRPRALRSRGHPSTSGPGSPTNGGRMGSRVRRRARWALSGTLGPRLRGVGWSPHTPPAGLCPRGPKTVQIRPLLGSNFSGFLAPCGAKSRGGGGAPPTTLILLRNQRPEAERRRSHRTPRTVVGSEGPQAQYRGLKAGVFHALVGQARGFPRTGLRRGFPRSRWPGGRRGCLQGRRRRRSFDKEVRLKPECPRLSRGRGQYLLAVREICQVKRI